MIRRHPDTITIIPTYQCTAACENCCFGSHPGVRERLSLERILHHIDQAASLGSVKLVVFTGGECFLLQDDLVQAVARCTSHGLASRCVSNGYWAVSERSALDRLRPLVEAGLGDLNVSTGDAHQEFIPIDRIVNAMKAAATLQIRSLVVIEAKQHRGFSAAALRADPRWAELEAQAKVKYAPESFESPWMSMDHLAHVEQPERKLACRSNLDRRAGCDSVLRTIVVTPSEQLGACCGLTREQIPELNLGSLRDRSMASLVDSMSDDLMKLWVALDGPDHILAWASSIDPDINWEKRFAHHCDSCRFMYSDPRVANVIASHWTEVADDILLRFSALGMAAKPDEENSNNAEGGYHEPASR
jgi:hypothetical protein